MVIRSIRRCARTWDAMPSTMVGIASEVGAAATAPPVDCSASCRKSPSALKMASRLPYGTRVTAQLAAEF